MWYQWLSHDHHMLYIICDMTSMWLSWSHYSGQLISGPPRKKKDIAKEVFEAAKQYVNKQNDFVFYCVTCRQGAIPVEEEEQKEKSKQKSSFFHGIG